MFIPREQVKDYRLTYKAKHLWACPTCFEMGEAVDFHCLRSCLYDRVRIRFCYEFSRSHISLATPAHLDEDIMTGNSHAA